MKSYDIPNNDRNMAAVIASQNLRKPAIQAAIAEMNAKADSPAIAALTERKERMSAFLRAAKAEDVAVREAIAASDQLNRMEQVYVERSQVDQRIEIVVHGFFSEGVPLPDTQPPLAIGEGETSAVSDGL